MGSDETGRKEAFRAYRSVLKHRFREKPQIGTAQRIAFRRLLWAAVERPDEGMDDAGTILQAFLGRIFRTRSRTF